MVCQVNGSDAGCVRDCHGCTRSPRISTVIQLLAAACTFTEAESDNGLKPKKCILAFACVKNKLSVTQKKAFIAECGMCPIQASKLLLERVCTTCLVAGNN